MAEKNSIFADSNYFVALFNRADSFYKKAQSIGKYLKANRIRLIISNLVFLEVVTVLSMRGGRAAAYRAGRYFFEDEFVEICYVDEYLHKEAWRIFKQVPSKNISFVDCSVLAVMNAESIGELLSFDKDFGKLKRYHKFEILN